MVRGAVNADDFKPSRLRSAEWSTEVRKRPWSSSSRRFGRWRKDGAGAASVPLVCTSRLSRAQCLDPSTPPAQSISRDQAEPTPAPATVKPVKTPMAE